MTETGDKSDLYVKGVAEVPIQAALDLVHEVEGEHPDVAAFKRLKWKIDLRLMPLLCITYALQSIDKTTLGYAAVFNLETDLNLQGTEYSWLGAIFYLGYLAWEFPTNMMLQKLPINYFMAGTVSKVTVISICVRELISLGHHLGHRVDVPCECDQFCRNGCGANISGRL